MCIIFRILGHNSTIPIISSLAQQALLPTVVLDNYASRTKLFFAIFVTGIVNICDINTEYVEYSTCRTNLGLEAQSEWHSISRP